MLLPRRMLQRAVDAASRRIAPCFAGPAASDSPRVRTRVLTHREEPPES